MATRRGRKSNIQKAVETFVKDIMENALIFYALFHKAMTEGQAETNTD